MSLLSCTGSAVVVQFASIVFNGMGFTAFTSLLLNLPTGAMAFLCVLGSGYCGRKFPNARFHLISIGCLPVILGTCLVWQLTNSQRVGRVIGFYLINFFVSIRSPLPCLKEKKKIRVWALVVKNFSLRAPYLDISSPSIYNKATGWLRGEADNEGLDRGRRRNKH